MLIFLYFKQKCIFLVFFELLENMCHTTRAIGQTLKEKKKTIFGIFENECHMVQATGQTQ